MQKIINKNYKATVKRGKITLNTTDADFVAKIREEVNEFENEFLFSDGKKMQRECGDIILSCFNYLHHNRVDIPDLLNDIIEFNSKRDD